MGGGEGGAGFGPLIKSYLFHYLVCVFVFCLICLLLIKFRKIASEESRCETECCLLQF